jgi:hypothetical protein
MYFDVNVEGPAPARPAKLKHRDRPTTGHKHEEKVVDKPAPAATMPPPPTVKDEFATPPPPKDVPVRPLEPEDDSAMLE